MENIMSKLSENLFDKFSMDFLRNQVLKNAYGNDDTIIAALDPRILIAWYLFFGVVPWFVSDLPFLLGSFRQALAEDETFRPLRDTPAFQALLARLAEPGEKA